MKQLPQVGTDWPTLEQELIRRKSWDFDWKSGRVPYLIYYVDETLKEVQDKSHAIFSI